MDGIAAAREVMEARDVPVVFLTSHAEEVTWYGYVLKEAADFNFVQAIKTAVSLHESQRRKASEAALSYREAFEWKNEELRAARALLERGEELAGLGSWEWDITTDTWTMSQNWYRIHGATPRRMTSAELMAHAHSEDRDRIRDALERARDETGRYDVEHRIVREDTETVRVVHAIGEAEISQQTGELTKIIGSSQDMTDIKEAARLEAKLHHRIKNNLAMVSSLISLKERSLGEEIDLSDIRHQVDAIAFIFDRPRETDGFTHIQVEPYIRELLDAILSFYPGGPVEVRVDIGDLLLPSKAATSIGLIVNELATNAMKHGFREGETPSFSVTLERSEDEYELTVSNSGRRLPVSVDIEGGKTLGLKLVSALVADIDGIMEIRRASTPEYTIRFPVQ